MSLELQNQLLVAVDARLHELKAEAERTGRRFSEAQLLKQAGLPQSTISRLRRGQMPAVAYIAGLEAALSLKPGALLSVASGAAPSLTHQGEALLAGDSRASISGPRIPKRTEMPQDLPVYGTAEGAQGDGAFHINLGGQIDRVRRPPALIANRDAFAIYVEGDSMEPRFEPGELVVVDPNRPVRPGDDVILLLESPEQGREPRAYIKRLVRRGAERVIAKQFNPAKDVEFPADAIKRIFRVLRMNELLV